MRGGGDAVRMSHAESLGYRNGERPECHELKRQVSLSKGLVAVRGGVYSSEGIVWAFVCARGVRHDRGGGG